MTEKSYHGQYELRIHQESLRMIDYTELYQNEHSHPDELVKVSIVDTLHEL
jgi:hypothetical protein